MNRNFKLAIALMLALVITGGGYAFTYMTATTALDIAVLGQEIATAEEAAAQPDWDSLIPSGMGASTETLRPTAVGDETGISSQSPVSGAHWDKVDEATADDSSTYVYTTSTSYQRDLYNIPSSTGSGTINNVTVYFRFANSATYDFYAIAYTGPGNVGTLKTVEIPSSGNITDTVIDTLEFDSGGGVTPDIIPITGDVYAIAYAGDGDDGFLKTVQIASNGQITDTVIDTLEFDTTQGMEVSMIHVSGDVYAIAYRGKLDDGFLQTVEIASNGQITDAVIDTLEFDTSVAYNPRIIHISGNVYAIGYGGDSGDGFLKTIEITTGGQITDTVIDILAFSNTNYNLDTIHISGYVYAIAYEGYSYGGYLETVEIYNDGQIKDTVNDTLEFDGTYPSDSRLIHISGDFYAVAYSGESADGYLKTVEIASDGQITDTVIDTLEFDTSDGREPEIIHISGDVYTVAYEGPDSDGFLKTVEIPSSGNITDTVIDTLEFDISQGLSPSIIPVTSTPGNVYARATIKTYDTVYTGSEESTSSGTFTTKAQQWLTNTSTDAPWTWEEIDALQIGVDLKTGAASDLAACTQVYVKVNYGDAGSCGNVPTGDLFEVTPDNDYIGDLAVNIYLTNTGNLTKAYNYLNMELYLEGSVEAGETPDYRLLTLGNGVATFHLEGYSPGTYTLSVTGGSYCLVSTDTSEWEAGWTVTPEFYCEILQR
jgi:hypothetical protein